MAGIVMYDRATHTHEPLYIAEPIMGERGLDPGLWNELGASLGCDLDARKGDTLDDVLDRLRACQDRGGRLSQ